MREQVQHAARSQQQRVVAVVFFCEQARRSLSEQLGDRMKFEKQTSLECNGSIARARDRDLPGSSRRLTPLHRVGSTCTQTTSVRAEPQCPTTRSRLPRPPRSRARALHPPRHDWFFLCVHADSRISGVHRRPTIPSQPSSLQEPLCSGFNSEGALERLQPSQELCNGHAHVVRA